MAGRKICNASLPGCDANVMRRLIVGLKLCLVPVLTSRSLKTRGASAYPHLSLTTKLQTPKYAIIFTLVNLTNRIHRVHSRIPCSFFLLVVCKKPGDDYWTFTKSIILLVLENTNSVSGDLQTVQLSKIYYVAGI